MPIHVRAEPGDYAEAVLLPGDPLRAKYIAETYLEDVVQRNAERGLLGYTGTYKGKPVSVQGTGMGCPGATIVFEELIQLGCKKLIRVGTCGGLQAHHALGDVIVALSAVPADSTAMHLVNGEPHCPTASWELIHGAVHAAKEQNQPRSAASPTRCGAEKQWRITAAAAASRSSVSKTSSTASVSPSRSRTWMTSGRSTSSASSIWAAKARRWSGRGAPSR